MSKEQRAKSKEKWGLESGALRLRHQAAFAVALKGRAKVIDIAIDSGYTILVHKKSLPFLL
jgi:hypothetical protein